ncbi:MAG: prolyl oligopeptidase family serine peptidase [Flavobacteriaceae bacterium]|nr:prolyl oligopeptidase family serine peptidase [Flavobacteriaceae bacterium]
MKAVENVRIAQVKSKPIVADFYFKNDGKPKPVVIFCHGYKGYKDWGAWNLMVDSFVNEALFFTKFNFSHNGGTMENPIDFPDLNAFGENTFTKELDDIETVLDYITSHPDFKENIDLSDITLVGHSRGGGTVLVKAGESTRIKRVVSWAGVSDFGARFPTGDALAEWKANGVAYIENARTKQQMPHVFNFYTNFKENEARLTIQTAVENLKIPQLIIQGAGDEVVKPAEAIRLQEWNPTAILKLIPNANHTFGAVHPWTKETMPSDLRAVVEATIDFIKQ